ncbi:MAG: Crp/Fnr family transcriptional regulator [Aureispira sp.]|nr:Crp/Fnr family transcriptional regulator [Aureispira sp.]
MEKLRAYLNSIHRVKEETWEVLKALFVQKQLPKGEHFIKAGAYAKKIAFLQEGYLRGYYRHANGTEYNKHFFKSPAFIGGYSSLVTKQPTQISQQALTDCVILEASYQKIIELSDQYTDLVWLSKGLAEQFLVQKEHREIQLVLLEASERYEIFRKEFPELEQLIPQYHIAAYLGVSATQLSRIRKKKLQK